MKTSLVVGLILIVFGLIILFTGKSTSENVSLANRSDGITLVALGIVLLALTRDLK